MKFDKIELKFKVNCNRRLGVNKNCKDFEALDSMPKSDYITVQTTLNSDPSVLPPIALPQRETSLFLLLLRFYSKRLYITLLFVLAASQY
jgi:hypothetical protein